MHTVVVGRTVEVKPGWQKLGLRERADAQRHRLCADLALGGRGEVRFKWGAASRPSRVARSEGDISISLRTGTFLFRVDSRDQPTCDGALRRVDSSGSAFLSSCSLPAVLSAPSLQFLVKAFRTGACMSLGSPAELIPFKRVLECRRHRLRRTFVKC
jgi:hypothetical protein